METAKQKAIREAYGEHWDNIKVYIDSEGFVETYDLIIPNKVFDDLCLEVKVNNAYKFRPKSLQGIENNNGWITIESEADLPKETATYTVVYKDGTIIEHHFSVSSDFDRVLFLEEFTHYQPIVKPLKPVY